MGLPCEITDVSSNSIPILLVVLVAQCVCNLKSLLLCFLQWMGLHRFRASAAASAEATHAVVVGEGRLSCAVGSGLTGLVVLSEHLNVSRVYTFRSEGGSSDCDDDEDGDDGPDDCVVCMSELRDGDQVSRLACCRHVFHRACLEGWFDRHHNTSCPLCRAPLMSGERVMEIEGRVSSELVACFSPSC